MQTNRNGATGVLLLAACLTLLLPPPVAAAEVPAGDVATPTGGEEIHAPDPEPDDEDREAGSEEAAAEAAEEELEERPFSVFGHLNFAFGVTDGNTILGLDEDVTTDYRTAAAQVRYRLTEASSVVVQISHEALGSSPTRGLRDEVELDWAFYRRDFGDGGRLLLGRVPVPFGLFSEVRDVGTVLPLFRPPVNFYHEVAFANETADGLVVGHAWQGPRWGLEADVYAGSWEMPEAVGQDVGVARAEEAYGAQIWLRPPVPGLRVGVGGNRVRVEGGLLRASGVRTSQTDWHVSIEWVGQWLELRSEYRHLGFRSGQFEGYYAQSVVALSPVLELVLQAEAADYRLDLPRLRLDLDLDTDFALGLVYRPRPDLALKAEAHRNEGYRIDAPPVDVLGPPVRTDYALISLATSF